MRYPDIRLVYWAGGNPFHHHQDINRLRRAFKHPETIIVHESAWTSTARHADIVLPATTTLERDDIGAADRDPLMIAMKRLIEPVGAARDDYDIFSGIARQLGKFDAFTEGRSSREWLAFLYETTRSALEAQGHDAPSFETFWQRGELRLPTKADDGGPASAFRIDPKAAPLPTPSGKIEIFSETVESFDYDDCQGHPRWYPARSEEHPEPDIYPLQIVCNQPHQRLHSQLDYGDFSRSTKIKDREPVRIHPQDAFQRGITNGDIVRLFNDRGSCLAGAILSEDLTPGVLQLSTGAWFEPDDPTAEQSMCIHGNPNILTRDTGTSKLAQGSTGQIARAQAERYTAKPPDVRVFESMVFGYEISKLYLCYCWTISTIPHDHLHLSLCEVVEGHRARSIWKNSKAVGDARISTACHTVTNGEPPRTALLCPISVLGPQKPPGLGLMSVNHWKIWLRA